VPGVEAVTNTPTPEQIEEFNRMVDAANDTFREMRNTLVLRAEQLAVSLAPVILLMEDAGLMPSTYDEDILEPEWEVFQ
jgi:hypothetical protein